MAAIKTQNMTSSNLMIGLTLISLLAVGATVFASKAIITDILRDNKIAAAKEKANDQLDKNLTNAPQLVDAYKNLGATALLLDQALPTTSDFPALIVALENMSRDAGFKLKSVTPASAGRTTTTKTTSKSATSKITTPPPAAYSFSLDFNGTYASLLSFNKAIETSARPMRIKSMQFTGTGSALIGSIDIETYYQGKSTLPITTEKIQ